MDYLECSEWYSHGNSYNIVPAKVSLMAQTHELWSESRASISALHCGTLWCAAPISTWVVLSQIMQKWQCFIFFNCLFYYYFFHCFLTVNCTQIVGGYRRKIWHLAIWPHMQYWRMFYNKHDAFITRRPNAHHSVNACRKCAGRTLAS